MKAFETTVDRPLDQVEAEVRAALVAEGFGVLTEIDVAATLEAKLGVKRPAMRILGACNPSLAHRALQIEPSVSLMLPCNVVVESTQQGTRVSVADPSELLGGPQLAGLAQEAAGHLRNVIGAVAAPR